MTVSNLREQKALLRSRTLAQRDALSAERRIEFSIAASEHGAELEVLSADNVSGQVVASFLPIRSEIDARPLMAILAERGARLCLPVVVDRTTIVFRELLREAELVNTGFGTVGPGVDAAVLDPSILIVPLSVFDDHGGRVGYGAGHYDRAIEKLVGKGITPTLIGLAFSMQQAERVPTESHDRALAGVLTENGFVEAVAG